jgi:hypothetical protein
MKDDFNAALLPYHPFANNFPLMDKHSLEFKAMVDSVKAEGLLEPITMHDGKVLDGRNRVRGCFAAGVKLEPKNFIEFNDANGTGPLAFVFSRNLYRRHLTPGQRAMLAGDMATAKHGGDHKSELSRAAAAKLWCVSLDSVEGAAFIKQCAVPKVTAKVRAGRMTIWRARMLAKLTDEEQRAAPDVKFDGTRRLKPPALVMTAPSARARLKMDDDGKLRFRDHVVEPWFRDHMAAEENRWRMTHT